MPETAATSSAPTAENCFDLEVDRVRTVATGVIELTLRSETELPRWTAGSHVDVTLGPDLVRQYSLCGSTDDHLTFTISVLHEIDGRGGSARVHQLREGDKVTVKGPRNHFALEPSPRYLFIAGGIGITPILTMITEAERMGAEWRLLYGGRTRASMAYADDLMARYQSRVTLHPQDEFGLLDLETALHSPEPGTLVYCCGPEPLLAAVESACERWPTGSLHVERFSARSEDLAERPDDATIEVEFRDSGITLQVPPGTTILEAAPTAGLPVDSSCHEGICGTCETAVLEGVPDHRDAVLTAAERESGSTMMICCSRARGPRLVLDL
ncbi:PDR/VanB family oxidoreductase [Pseudonocardia alni]|uniref:PDR/VanB family oxidoreductase n=1 Tax=Pseudonocardia alni TaxID=33907 RepID=UPI00280BE602|nr:PDR/VanB family oxidoreductase [Pseudonocardia alni]